MPIFIGVSEYGQLGYCDFNMETNAELYDKLLCKEKPTIADMINTRFSLDRNVILTADQSYNTIQVH